MQTQIVGQVGPQVIADGTSNPIRQEKTGGVVVQELHGRYFEQVYRGNVFSALTQAAGALSVALATTYTGLLVYNPIGSPVNLSILKVKLALSVAPASISMIGLISGSQTVAPTGLTAASVYNNQVGSQQTGAGVAYSAATILTPVWRMFLYDGFTASALPAPTLPVDLEGSVIVKPGSFIALGAMAAVTGYGMIMWEEIPV